MSTVARSPAAVAVAGVAAPALAAATPPATESTPAARQPAATGAPVATVIATVPQADASADPASATTPDPGAITPVAPATVDPATLAAADAAPSTDQGAATPASTATLPPAAQATRDDAVRIAGIPARSVGTATESKPGFPMAAPAGGSPAGAGSIGGAVLALLLVIALIFVLGKFARRVPGFGGGGGNAGLRIVGALSLGPRERVVVVDVGGTQLLLGTGTGGTRVLHQLETPLPEAPAAGPSPFAQALAQQLRRKKSS